MVNANATMGRKAQSTSESKGLVAHAKYGHLRIAFTPVQQTDAVVQPQASHGSDIDSLLSITT